jgi:predicted N-acetyltransferase YhbS
MSAVVVRPMREADLDAADRIFRLAFGTFLRLPDPMQFGGDSDHVRGRFRADPTSAFVAERDGEVVGSNLMVRWGSAGFFGPLSVRPDLWGEKIAQRLMESTMQRFADWGTTHIAFFTFAESAKHIALYGKYGFHPRFLTAVMARPVSTSPAPVPTVVSALSASERRDCLAEARRLTGTLFDGLDVGSEITALTTNGLGDTVLVRDAGGTLRGLATCHVGAGSEAGSDTCFVKFGAVPVGPTAPADFDVLLDACEAFAAARGLRTLLAGASLAREGAYKRMQSRGFRTVMQGVGMHRPNESGWSRPDVWAMDDLR